MRHIISLKPRQSRGLKNYLNKPPNIVGGLVEVRFVGGSPLCYACVITARLSDYPLPHRKPEKKVREADLCED